MSRGGEFCRLCFSYSITSNELFATCWPSGGWGVWVLQRVKYVNPHLKKKIIKKLRLLKWYLNYLKLLNSRVICKNRYFPADTDVC